MAGSVNLTVGRLYAARNGDIVVVTDDKAGKATSSQRWKAALVEHGAYASAWEKDYRRYHSDGSWKTDRTASEHDLVREVARSKTEWNARKAPVAVSPEPVRRYQPEPQRTYDYTPPAPARRPETSVKVEPKENKMKSLLKNLFGAQIGQVKDGLVKLGINGEKAVRQADGSYVTVGPNGLTEIGDFTVDAFESLLFRMPTTEIAVGDLIVRKDKQGLEDVVWVNSLNADGSVDVFNPRTERRETLVQTKRLFGPKFYVKVVSIAEGLFGGAAPAEGAAAGGLFSNPLMLLALAGDDDKPGKKGGLGGLTDNPLMLMALMGGGGLGAPAAGANGMNPLLLMSLLGGDSDFGDNPLAMMALMGGNLFGAAPAAPAAAPRQ
jgi:hypothetical protein